MGAMGCSMHLFGSPVRVGSLVCLFTLCASLAFTAQPPARCHPQAPAQEDGAAGPDGWPTQAERETTAKAESSRLANLLAFRSQVLDYWRQLTKRQLDILRYVDSGLEWELESDSESEPESDSSRKDPYFVVTINDKERKDDDVFCGGGRSLIRVELYDDDNVVSGTARFKLSQQPASPNGTGAVRFVDKDGKKIDPNKPRTVHAGIPNEEVYGEGVEFGRVAITAEGATDEAGIP
jgi:hypothetical protein